MCQLNHLMHIFRLSVGLAIMIYAGAALAIDDCTPVDAKLEDGYEKIDIRNPGHYCLTEDLHARIEFADHPAEGRLITIRSSDVILDLQGHTLGRGRLFKNPGGAGIVITDQTRGPRKIADSRNIVIRNGVLQDFSAAIVYHDGRYSMPIETPVFDQKTNTYRFPINNIVLENITFKNNKADTVIRIPRDEAPPLRGNQAP